MAKSKKPGKKRNPRPPRPRAPAAPSPLESTFLCKGIAKRFRDLDHRLSRQGLLTDDVILDFFEKEEEKAQAIPSSDVPNGELSIQYCQFVHHLRSLCPEDGPVMQEIARRYPDGPRIFQLAEFYDRAREKVLATFPMSPQDERLCRAVWTEALQNPQSITVQTRDRVMDLILFQPGSVSEEQKDRLWTLISNAIRLDGDLIATSPTEDPATVSAFGFLFRGHKAIPMNPHMVHSIIEGTL